MSERLPKSVVSSVLAFLQLPADLVDGSPKIICTVLGHIGTLSFDLLQETTSTTATRQLLGTSLRIFK